MTAPPLFAGAVHRTDARESPATACTDDGASGAVGCERGVTDALPEGDDGPYEFTERIRTYMRTFGAMLTKVADVAVEMPSAYTDQVTPPFKLYSTM